MPALKMKDTSSPDTYRSHKRYSVPSHLAPPTPTGLHWSITDMTISQEPNESQLDTLNSKNRSASLPFLTLHDLQPYEQPPVIRVVVLGASGVGKTSLIMQFVSSLTNDMSDYESMFSENPEEDMFEKSVEIDGKMANLKIIDSPAYGTEAFEMDEDKYLSQGDVYLLVYSVTDRRSFKKANEMRFKLQRTKESETVPIILTGNKTDLERSREVSFAEGKHFAALFDCKLIETSAPISHNIDELFNGAVRQVRLRTEDEDNSSHGSNDSGGKHCKNSPTLKKRRRSSMLHRARSSARGVLERILRRKNSDEPPGYRARSKSCHIMEVL